VPAGVRYTSAAMPIPQILADGPLGPASLTLALETPSWMTPQLVTSLLVTVVILHLALGAAAYLIYAERKIAAFIQDRVGPNRTGPFGLLQPIADGLKLFFKEDFIPERADRVLFLLAPALTAIPAIIGFIVIPWGGELDLATIPILSSMFDLSGTVKIIGADVSVGIIYLIAVTSVAVYGVVVGGWASNSKYSFLGGLRASAQMVSYEIPMGLALLCVVLLAGDVRPYAIIEQQSATAWNIVHMPIVAILFYTCMLAEANRTPFDLAEAESELVGGWHTEYSSMKWALFFLGEYVNLFVGGAFFALLFLGGWSINPVPGLVPFDLPAGGSFWIILLQMGVVLGKAFLLVGVAMVIRWTIPRFRFDQLMRLAWEAMIPASLVFLLAVSVMVYLGLGAWMWAASIATVILIVLVQPLIPRSADPNHKVAMIGSRYSPLPEAEAAKTSSTSSAG